MNSPGVSVLSGQAGTSSTHRDGSSSSGSYRSGAASQGAGVPSTTEAPPPPPLPSPPLPLPLPPLPLPLLGLPPLPLPLPLPLPWAIAASGCSASAPAGPGSRPDSSGDTSATAARATAASVLASRRRRGPWAVMGRGLRGAYAQVGEVALLVAGQHQVGLGRAAGLDGLAADAGGEHRAPEHVVGDHADLHEAAHAVQVGRGATGWP